MTVFRQIFRLAFWFVFLNATSVCAAVNGVRIGNQSDTAARIVVDLSEKPDFRVFALQNPMRVVVDVEKTGVAFSNADLPKIGGFFSAIRASDSASGGARIVFELNKNAVVKKSFVLTPQSGFQWRLVVDLEVSRNSFSSPKKERIEDRENPVVEPAQKPLIVLDPGHGGKDSGAIGVSGVYEKHLTLAMAKQLRTLLEKSGRYRVKLTRETDIALALYARRKFARSVGADLFISIHADSIRKQTTRGLSIYTLSEKASDKEAEKLAESENKADIIAGLDLSGETQEVTDILIDLARRETNNHSSFFAEKVVREIKEVVLLLPNTHRFAGFAVLKSPDVPSVLMEMGYLSNREEERLLRQADYREKLAVATVRAVNSYFLEKHKANFN